MERYHLIDDGNTMEAEVTIEDPVFLILPLHVVKHWRKVQGPMTESRCADSKQAGSLRARPLSESDLPLLCGFQSQHRVPEPSP